MLRVAFVLGILTTLLLAAGPWLPLKDLNGVDLPISLLGIACSLVALLRKPKEIPRRPLLRRGLAFLALALNLWPWILILVFLGSGRGWGHND